MTKRQSFGSVRQLASGRYQASYWYGGRRQVAEATFRTKSEARAHLDSIGTDIRRQLWIDPVDGEMSVAELAAAWLASNPSKRPTTWSTDEIGLRVHILPSLGEMQIAKVRPPHIHSLVASWVGKAAPRTVRRQYGTLRAIFAFAVECDWLARTPCRGVKLPPITSTRRHSLTADDVASIAEATEERYRPMVWLGAVLGLRWSEAAGLRVGRVDFLQRTLTVAEALTRDGKGSPIISPPKSQAGSRTLAMPGVLADLLAEHMARCGLSVADGNQFLFQSANRTPLRYSNWRRSVWLPAATSAGLPGAGFHDLRRASATVLVSEGVDVKTVQVRLGHSDPRLTLQIYAGVLQEAEQRAADVLGDHFILNCTKRSKVQG